MLAAGWPGPLVYRRPYPGSAVDTCTRPPLKLSPSSVWRFLSESMRPRRGPNSFRLLAFSVGHLRTASQLSLTFSRRAIAVEVFKNWPKSGDVTGWLDTVIQSVGHSPKCIVSDRGAQFREEYKDWCFARGIKPRFGAIGQHGSIAVVERFILSLKNECTRRILVPLRIDEFRDELLAYCRWYNAIRPHQSLYGRTPSEVSGDVVAAVVPRFEPRLRLLESNQRCCKPDLNVVPVDNLRLDVTPFEGRAHLTVVRLDWAA